MTQPTATSRDAPSTLIPKLRFPDFRKDAGWKPYLLEELENLGWVELGRGDVISSQDIRAIPGEYPIYSSSVKNNGLMGSYGRFMFDEELISWSVDGGGDFFHRPKHKFSVTNVSGYMRVDTSRLSYRFLASYLQALHALLTFDYQFKAHPSVIRKLYRLSIPSPAEQQKIAECLSTLDELIGAESQKLDALKAHKKGIMQQLFPREGETLPRLRFPEFHSAPEWEEAPLSKFIVSLDAGVSVNSGDGPAADGELGVLKTSAVTNGVFEPSENKVVTSELEQSRLAEPVLADTIIISRMNTPALVGANAYVERSASNLFLPDRLWAAKPREKVSMRFLAFVLGSDRGRASLATLATGTSGSMKNITKPDVLGMSITAPKPDEQHRIATCLSSLDELIAAQSDRLSALQTHKQGLLQQLFPSPADASS